MKGRKNIEEVLKSLRIGRILIPIFIGVAVVLYLLWSHFDIDEFRKIEFGFDAIAWLSLGIGFYVIRHLAYSFRLYVLCEGQISYKKAIQLIFIWEFATTISPTSLGGSAMAMVFLAQEKLKTSKAVMVVLYTIVLDTLFFLISIPLLLGILGPRVIRPEIIDIWSINGYGFTFFIVFTLMILYGFFFYYGLFHRPDQIKRFINFLARWKILKRFKDQIIQTGVNIETSSIRLKNKPFQFHVQAIAATFTAWIFKFALMFCIMYAFIDTIPRTFHNTLMIYGRYEAMFAITAASPTPGGSGLAEYLFGGFYSDYVPISLAVVIAFFWRLIAYYTYLLAGVIIVPAWLRRVLKRRNIVSSRL